jgi:hypothetical protein
MSEPTKTKLLTSFLDINASSLDWNGIYPVMCMFRDRDDEMICASMAVDGADVLRGVLNILTKQPIVECAFGIDRIFAKDQGLQFHAEDFLSIFYWDGERFWYGVMQYYFSEKHKGVHAVDWDNSWWNKILSLEQDRFNVESILKLAQHVP